MKNVFKFISVLFIFTIVISCEDDDDNMNVIDGPTALDFLMESPNHSIMVDALVSTQLDFTLDSARNLTIFAPTDQAFRSFLAANNFGNVNAVPDDLLRTLLLYHFQSDIRTIERFNSQYFKTQAQIDDTQMDVYIQNSNSVLTLNNEARVTIPDNTVSNGIVHVVDNVLDLPSVFTLIAANPNFSNLTTALNQEGLDITLDDLEDAAAPFTVFAPSDAAFTALIASDPNDNLNDFQDVLNQNNFDDKLLYHVLANQTLRQDAFVDGDIIDPLGTGTFTLSTNSGISIIDGSGTTTNLVATNLTSFNGVVHTLDFVLRQN